jgi:glyoxylase-like metal-dependent hydrolase (beta-lactamase superfamily II)
LTGVENFVLPSGRRRGEYSRMPTEPATIALEDNFDDVLNKAQRGLGLADGALAKQAEITPYILSGLKKGRLDEAALLRVAPVLNLHGPSLLALARRAWYPRVPNLVGLAQVSTAWKDFRVNAFVAWNPTARQAIVFDTGTTPAPILAVVKENKLRVELLLITHTHGDHIACFDELRAKLGQPRAYVSAKGTLAGAEPIGEGSTLSVGSLHIEVRRTSGHAACGLSYVVRGLAQPVVVVGDALFAGSMGGARSTEAYAEALETNRAQLFSLSDDAVVCPGHGPRTTIGQEKRHNPFFPEYKTKESGA